MDLRRSGRVYSSSWLSDNFIKLKKSFCVAVELNFTELFNSDTSTNKIPFRSK